MVEYQTRGRAPAASALLVRAQGAASWLSPLGALSGVLGVILWFAIFAYDYVAALQTINPGVGLKQILGLSAASAMIAGGALIQAVARPAERAGILRFWAVAAQVVLLALVFRVYEIENRVFYEVVAPLIAIGFVVHHQLKDSWRKPFFFLLAVTCILAVFAVAKSAAGYWLVGLGIGLFAIVNLPIALWARAGLLVAVGVFFAAMRLGWMETGWSRLILPLLASMFVFRAIIYLYDVRNKKGPTNLWQRLSYFFLPPNVVFPFFPVVDFATFGRSYYNEEATRIYQRGVTWMLRGFLHLLVYRVIYLYGVIAPEDVNGAFDFLHYIGANFGLYFRISGMFHLIIGVILLFGYNLPETHTRFYFSNSFIDFWRRINIYWKNFMQKLFFNPVFTRLKRAGASHDLSLLGAIGAVFFATWALHAYVWFWLRGSLHTSLPDILFWSFLGVALAVQTTMEARRAAAPHARANAGLLGPRAFLVVRTFSMMLVLCVIWSMWTSETMAEWFRLLVAGVLPAFAAPGAASFADWATTLLSLGIGAVALTIATGFTLGLGAPGDPQAAASGKRRSARSEAALPQAVFGAALITVLVVAQGPALDRFADAQTREFVKSIGSDRLNSRDEEMLTRGYYERLTNVNDFNSRLWELYMARPNQLPVMTELPFVRPASGLLRYEFIPGTSGSFNGAIYTINSWGMRGDEVSLEKPEGVVRIAFVGPSISVGWGVSVEDRFDRFLVDSLNGEADLAGGQRFQMLNFSVDGYGLSQRLAALDGKAWDFRPDLAVMVVHRRDVQVDYHLAEFAEAGVLEDSEIGRELAAAAGVVDGMTYDDALKRFQDSTYEVMAAGYAHFAEQARRNGATPVWLYIPLVNNNEGDRELETMRALAEQAGIVTIDLSRVFEGMDEEALFFARWDVHFNALGHRIVAEALERSLRDLEERGLIDIGVN